MPKAKKATVSKTKVTKTSPKKVSSSTKAKEYKSTGPYDNSRNLVIGGVIGIFLTYVIITRALNTGSYWEYFFGLAILIISIRLFIRSIRLK
jgi:hypothetical protein